MAISGIEVFVEEDSAKEFIMRVLPRLIDRTLFSVHPHQGKMDLIANLPSRLRALASEPNTFVIVLVDRDSEDCHILKQKLEKIAAESGFKTRSNPHDSGDFRVINRIAVEELEAWYFGDWDAVRKAFPDVPANIPGRSKYSDPDAISGGTAEAFERILRRANYHRSGLRKKEAARAIAPHIVPALNTSKSFQVFRDAVIELVTPDSE